MTPFIILRHGPTAWNEAGRIQGRSDQPLSPAGEAAVKSWRIPKRFADYAWLSSPLTRARQTAALLGRAEARVEARLIETDWGAWEGERLADLRRRLGEEMTRMEARGLGFKPPNGESPAELQERLAPLLRDLATARHPTAAVAHKGVIRALYALASGWDMRGKPPQKLRPACAHAFLLDDAGAPRIDQLNIALTSETR